MSILAALENTSGFDYQYWVSSEVYALTCDYVSFGFFCLADSEGFTG